jgi:hypothetical protein
MICVLAAMKGIIYTHLLPGVVQEDTAGCLPKSYLD